MKELMLISSLIMCIFFTSCENNTDIGIIGGADGPTQIIVSEEEEKEMYILQLQQDKLLDLHKMEKKEKKKK